MLRWTSEEESPKFVNEVKRALDVGMTLLAAHEFPSLVGDDATRKACAFNDFWRDGWTPPALLKGDRNVYKQIATSLKAGAWRLPGLMQLALKLADGPPPRTPLTEAAHADVKMSNVEISKRLRQHGHLKVNLDAGAGLRAADLTGLSDPYGRGPFQPTRQPTLVARHRATCHPIRLLAARGVCAQLRDCTLQRRGDLEHGDRADAQPRVARERQPRL